MGEKGGPSAEEMVLKPEETRILSDAELVKGGARVNEKGRLEPTQEQVDAARDEMEAAEAEKHANQMAATYPKVFAFLDGHIALFHEDVADAEKEMEAPTATNAERGEKGRLIAKWKEFFAEYEEALKEFRNGKLGPVTRIIGKRIGQDLDSDDQERNAIGRRRIDQLLGELKIQKPF